MNLLIRNLDPTAIKVFDDRAKERGVSRNEYLVGLLTGVANNYLMKDERQETNRMFSRVVDALEVTHDRMENIEKIFEKLYMFMIVQSGLSLDEVEEMIGEMIVVKDEE